MANTRLNLQTGHSTLICSYPLKYLEVILEQTLTYKKHLKTTPAKIKKPKQNDLETMRNKLGSKYNNTTCFFFSTCILWSKYSITTQ